jgi:hypothetical protein
VQPPLEDDDPARGPDDRAPAPSPRVRLEVELLASDQPAPKLAPAIGDRRHQHTVLVVAADPDVRQYVRECLRERDDLGVLEASAVAMAERMVAEHAPELLIVDGRDAAVLRAIPEGRAILLADEVPVDMPRAHIATLMPPFGGRNLQALVDLLLS